MLGAEGDDELLVGILLARLVQDAHVRLAAVERLGRLAEAAGETVVHERELEDALERVEDRHLALGGGIGRDLDLLGGGLVVLFYVRLQTVSTNCSTIRHCPHPNNILLFFVVEDICDNATPAQDKGTSISIGAH